MTTIKAVVLNRENDIIALLDCDPGKEKEIEVAGAIAIDGSPVNRKTYRISTSKASLARATRSDAQFATRHEHKSMIFYMINED